MKESITPIKAPVGVDVHKRRCKVVEFDHGEIKAGWRRAQLCVCFVTNCDGPDSNWRP